MKSPITIVRWVNGVALLVLAPLLVACNGDGATAPTGEISAIDGRALNAETMAKLRENGQGCTFSIPDPSGGVRIIGLHGKMLPLPIRAIETNRITHRAEARILRARVRAEANTDTITVKCLVPRNMGYSEFAGLLETAAVERKWQGMYGVLRHRPVVPATAFSQPPSREAQQLRYELMGDAPTPVTVSGNGRALYETYWCEGFGAVSPAMGGAPRASLNLVVGCTCATTNHGITWNCTMWFAGTSADFAMDDWGWDGALTCDAELCGGGDVPIVPIPEPTVFAVCDSSDAYTDAGWGGAVPVEPDPAEPSPTICASASALSCMNANPGVYVGEWNIPATNGFANHTAVVTIPPPHVTELLGWPDNEVNAIWSASVPKYGAFTEYRWVKVGDPFQVGTFDRALTKATNEYRNWPYMLSSNRFTASVLKYAGTTLTKNQRAALGNAPGLCNCGNCEGGG